MKSYSGPQGSKQRNHTAATVFATVLIAVGATACGGSSGSDSPADTSSSADYVAAAAKITQDAEHGLVYSAANDFTPVDQLKVMINGMVYLLGDIAEITISGHLD